MILPVQLAFHGLTGSPGIADLVNEEAAKLDHLYRGIVSCRVAIELVSVRHRHGNPLRVTIELAVPGHRFVVDSHPATRQVLSGEEDNRHVRSVETAPEHKDDALAVRSAFRKMARRLEDFAERRRGEVKTHAAARSEESD
jgi:hypothetical protein